MSRTRRMFTSTQKAEIVRRHLQDQVPVSELAAELDVQPSQIHQWVQAALAQIERAFEKPGKKPKRSAAKLEQLKDRKIYQLEQKLNLKNEVIAELMEENVKAKKLNGDL